jgi:hypothetical protein
MMLGYSIVTCNFCDLVGRDWFYGSLLTMQKLIAADEGPLCRLCREPLVLVEQIKAEASDRTC